MSPNDAAGKTEFRRAEMFSDRWSSYGANTAIESISQRPSPAQLKTYEIFRAYDDDVLNRLSPDVAIAAWKGGSVLFEEGTYIDIAFFIARGSVDVSLTRVARADGPAAPVFDPTRTAGLDVQGTRLLDLAAGTRVAPARGVVMLTSLDFDMKGGESVRLGAGEVFGEIGAMSGWPQSVTAKTAGPCELVHIRLPALRLMRQKSKDLKARLDATYRERALSTLLATTPLLRACAPEAIESLRRTVELVSLAPGDSIAEEGQPVDALYLVRSGFVRLSQRLGEGEIAVSYLSKGMTLGDAELVTTESGRWETTATSVEYAELVKISRAALDDLVRTQPDVKKLLWQSGVARTKEFNFSRKSAGYPELLDAALSRGFVQANALLAIDLEMCTRCDDCVRACAATHGGRPRFVREGTRYDNVLIAKSCYHCKDPVCLVGCPTGAIHRSGNAAVVQIDEPICIGCKSCANNCPYDAIVMHDTGTKYPDNFVPDTLRGRDRLVASKCDLCASTGHDPACVSNCPQACAFRVGSVEDLQTLVRQRG